MRSFRPSARATVVVAALAATIVVAGTTGAVAGKLITGNDIKDKSITKADLAKGSVGWSGQLDKATRAKITALAGAASTAGQPGAPGQAGAQGQTGAQGQAGAQGPAGQPGADGADGADGDGALVGWDYFGTTGWSTIDELDVTELRGLNDDRLSLPAAGVYLVTVRGMFLDDSASVPLIYLGDPLPDDGSSDLHSYSGDCGLTLNALMMGLMTCDSTFTVFAEGPGPLPVYLPGDGGECTREEAAAEESDCAVAPAVASVSVMRLGGDVPDTSNIPPLPELDPCGCPPLSGSLAEQRRTLGELRQFLTAR